MAAFQAEPQFVVGKTPATCPTVDGHAVSGLAIRQQWSAAAVLSYTST